MHPNRPSRLRPWLALAFLLAGCSSKQTTDPGGDTSGEHLITFSSDRGGAPATLYVYDIDAGGFHRLPNLDRAGPETLPSMSVDGLLIAFTGQPAANTDVLVYDRSAEAIQTRPKLATPANESWPRFAGDGVRLAFVSDVSGAKRVQLYDPQGDSLVALPGLAGATGDDDEPAPDQSGDRIAFVSTRAGKPEILVWQRGSGLLATPGLAGDSVDTEPSLTPDGRWLAFASNRSGGLGGWDVYLYDLTDQTLVPINGLNSSDDERFPSLSRDGVRIAFESNRINVAGGLTDLYRYSRTDSTVRVPAGLPSPGNDVQPYLRWR